MENKTPPMGEPNATPTPAALAAVTISLILPCVWDETLKLLRNNDYLPWLRENLLKRPATRYPIQHATCTDGPSFPTDSPEAITNGCDCSIITQERYTLCAYQCNTFNDKCTKTQKPFHDKPSQYTLDLRNS